MSTAGTSGIDADTLALLTDEERAAIEDPEYSPEELAAMKGIAGDDDDDDENAEENEDDGKEADGKGATQGQEGADDSKAEDDGKAKDPEPEPTPANAERADQAARYQAELPADYQARVDALKTDKAALKQQFKDGDIDFDAYNEKLEELDDRADELKEMKLKASISSDMNAQSAEQEWSNSVHAFAARVAKEVDYAKDESKQQDLDLFVKTLAANPANSDKPMNWFLDEAHKRVLALHQIAPAATQKKGEDDAKAGEKPNRKPPTAAVPKTLAQVPGSDGPGDVSGEFADMDNLDGLDLEQAIARMTPAQRERYAQS